MKAKNRLLVLGGTSASLDVVTTAKSMGIYTIVTDDQSKGVAKEVADESVKVSTTDMDGLLKLIRDKEIDGVFCGPSEFNIRNTMKVCELAGLPFYATAKQWNICSNKASFKELCRAHGVPSIPEYDSNPRFEDQHFGRIEFPVIVKPVDGCSSKGISICYDAEQLKEAYHKALEYSDSKNVIIEKYVENNGVGLSARYIANDGQLYLSLVGDRYIVDPYERTALISALILYPSKYTDYYLENIDNSVKKMFEDIDVKNGALFLQALPDNGSLYFHEMGFRLSGGLTYKITEAANGINDLKMMIRYALGGQMCTEDERENIDPYLGGKLAAILCIPLGVGTIGKIEGLDYILGELEIEDFVQYYGVGDAITSDKIGTLMQHFGRFKFFASSKQEMVSKIEQIQDLLRVKDVEGNDMIYLRFDTKRLD